MIELKPEAGPVLVVGGGTVAARKVRTLAEGGFSVTVIATQLAPAFARYERVRTQQRAFEAADIAAEAWALVMACTDDREVNRMVGELARQKSIPVLVSDSQAESTFFSPAVFRDGDLQVGVSTGGADPGLATTIRERIVGVLGTGWAERVTAARESRRERLDNGDDS